MGDFVLHENAHRDGNAVRDLVAGESFQCMPKLWP